MTDCRHCRRDTDLFLCTLCTKELGALLSDLPWLLRQLDITVTRQDKLGTAEVGKSSDNPSPVNVGAMELARNLRGQLGTVVRALCEPSHHAMPETTDSAILARWLAEHLQSVACSEEAGQIMREIRSATDAVIVAINRNNRMFIGPCTTVVGHAPDGQDIECGVTLYANRDTDGDIQCDKCKAWIEPRKQMLITIARRDLLTENELINMMAYLGDPITEAWFDKHFKAGQLTVRGYVHHGRVVPRLIRRGDPRVFSLKQAQQLLWRERDAA
jgi:K+/H+ antiporter YhaU regulatory subunit KhtT